MTSPRPARLLGILAVLALTAVIVVAIALTTGPSDPALGPVGSDEATGSAGPDGPTDRAEVLRVVDGDTIVVRIEGREERLRYIGLDAPELADRDGGREIECGAAEALVANERLVDGASIVLERDVSDRDRFGRLLRHVWVDDGGWLLVGLELVETGAAEARSYPPDTRRDDELAAAERRARDRGAGIWGAC